MSLVGTRPPTVDEWEQYELHHRSRMSTKPGITGMLLGRKVTEIMGNGTVYIPALKDTKKIIAANEDI